MNAIFMHNFFVNSQKNSQLWTAWCFTNSVCTAKNIRPFKFLAPALTSRAGSLSSSNTKAPMKMPVHLLLQPLTKLSFQQPSPLSLHLSAFGQPIPHSQIHSFYGKKFKYFTKLTHIYFYFRCLNKCCRPLGLDTKLGVCFQAHVRSQER